VDFVETQYFASTTRKVKSCGRVRFLPWGREGRGFVNMQKLPIANYAFVGVITTGVRKIILGEL
jgi:hypothetical protein